MDSTKHAQTPLHQSKLNYDLLINLNTIEYSDNLNFSIALDLISKGANVNLVNSKGETILMIAAKVGNIDTVNKLLTVPNILLNKQSISGHIALTMAARDGHEEVVAALLKRVDDVTIRDYMPATLRKAAKEGHFAVVKMLFDFLNIRVNEGDFYGNTPLMEAAKSGHILIIQVMLTHEEIDINLKNKAGETALVQAYNNGHHDIVALLINHGLNEQLRQVLTIPEEATKVNLTPAIGLIALGANINLQNEHGETIRMLAYKWGDKDTLSKLLVFEHPQSKAPKKEKAVEIKEQICHITPRPTVAFRGSPIKNTPISHLTKTLDDLHLNRQKKNNKRLST